MKSHRALAVVVLWIVFLTSSCGPKPEPVVDQATVVAKNASVRLKNSSTSRTLVTLNPGDKVEVLQQLGNWYRIRHGERLQGWMEESTIITNGTMTRIQKMATAAQKEPPQNTATMRDDGNMRLEPGRSTAVIRKLERGKKMEVLERVTTPRPNSDGALDVWLKVRPSPTEVGFVFAGLVDFDVPAEISQYTEGYTYTAVKPINQVQDSIAGTISWYVVGERSIEAGPPVDFNGVRVFTWNQKMHRYETAFRVRGIRGVYPLEIGQDKGNPTFRFYELGEDGSSRTPSEYVMFGVVTRPLNVPPKTDRTPSHKAPAPKETAKKHSSKKSSPKKALQR